MTPASRFRNLIAMLDSDDAPSGISAARKLIAGWPARAGSVLLRAFPGETAEVRAAILEAFAEARAPEAVDLILLLYGSDLPQDISLASRVLLRMGSLAFRRLGSVIRDLQRPLQRPGGMDAAPVFASTTPTTPATPTSATTARSAIRCLGELGRHGHRQASRYLAGVVESGIESRCPDIFCAAAGELASMRSRAGARRICALLTERHPSPQVRLACAHMLMSTDRLRTAIDPLIDTCLHDPDSEVRAAAMGVFRWAVEGALPSEMWEGLFSEAEHSSVLRAAVLRAMPWQFRPAHADLFERALNDPAPEVRQAAADLFSDVYDWGAPSKNGQAWREIYLRLLPAVERLASDVWEDTSVREAAAAALVATAATKARYSRQGTTTVPGRPPGRPPGGAPRSRALSKVERPEGIKDADRPRGAPDVVETILANSDEAPQVRIAAVRAFARQGGAAKEMSGLLRIIESSIDPELVTAALETLPFDGNFVIENKKALICCANRLFAMSQPRVHLAAMDLFRRMLAVEVIPVLVSYATDPNQRPEDRIQAGVTIGRLIGGSGEAMSKTWSKLARTLRESPDPITRCAGIPVAYDLWYDRQLALAERYQKDRDPLVRRYSITLLEELALLDMKYRTRLLAEVKDLEEVKEQEHTVFGEPGQGVEDGAYAGALWGFGTSRRRLARFTEELIALQGILVRALSDKDLGVRFAAVTLLGWTGLPDAQEIVESFRAQSRGLLHEGKSLSSAASLALKRLKQRAKREAVPAQRSTPWIFVPL